MNWKLSNTQRHDGLIKIQKIMLLFTILFLPITNMPRAMMISAIGEKLSYYPILIGLLVWFLEIYQTKKFNIDKKYLRYVSIFIKEILFMKVYHIITLSLNL